MSELKSFEEYAKEMFPTPVSSYFALNAVTEVVKFALEAQRQAIIFIQKEVEELKRNQND